MLICTDVLRQGTLVAVLQCIYAAFHIYIYYTILDMISQDVVHKITITYYFRNDTFEIRIA